jgi:hypothetical protein
MKKVHLSIVRVLTVFAGLFVVLPVFGQPGEPGPVGGGILLILAGLAFGVVKLVKKSGKN